VKELSGLHGIKVYPNSFHNSTILELSSFFIDAEVIINDILGKEMMRKRFSGNKMEIEKGNLESGVYFVKVRDNERQYVQKIIVE
jgi:hypothetical protein